MPNIPISCLPSHVDPKVQGLKVIVDCPQPGSSRATYRPPPISRWSMRGSDTVMVLHGSGTSKVHCPKKLSRSDLTQPNTGEQAVMLRTVSLVVCLVYGMLRSFAGTKCRNHQDAVVYVALDMCHQV